MARLKILFDYSPACRDTKTGIPLFVKNLYRELESIEEIEVERSWCRAFGRYRAYRFVERILYHKIYLPFKLQFGGYDIYIENQFIFRPLFKPSNTKVVNIIYDIGLILFDNIQTPKYTAKWRKRLPPSIKKSDILVTISKSSQKDIEKYLKKIEIDRPLDYIYANTDLVDNGSLSLQQIREKYSIEEDYFLFLGTLEPRKNPLILVKAFREFKRKSGSSIKLLFAGKKGWLYDEVIEYIKKYKLEDEIVFAGYISDSQKVSLLKHTKAFIFLSIYEGFGMPPLEAVRLDTPILLSDIAVFRELFEESAYYADPYSVDDVAQKMSLIVQTPPTIDSAIFDKFGWDRSAKRLVDIIRREVDKKN